ncbi:MAG: hypothetical protein ABSG33_08975 [Candidatus Bathyarchaeia archaeon]|jgi:hypothetical protein
MSDQNDMLSKVQGQMNLPERIAAFIPGFRGYKEKEIRRESDRLIRNHLYMKLSVEKTDLRAIEQSLADRRYFDVLTDMDRLLAKMDRVVEKVNHASYGYSGFFDAVKVKEQNLDDMIAFDNKLLDLINALTTEVNAFKTDLASGATSNLQSHVQSVTDKLESLENTFDQRNEIMMGVS